MPKRHGIDRNLVRINVTEKAHQIILHRKKHGEPVYRTIDRILSSYLDNDAKDWEDMYYQQIEITKTWKEKYENVAKQTQQLRFA